MLRQAAACVWFSLRGEDEREVVGQPVVVSAMSSHPHELRLMGRVLPVTSGYRFSSSATPDMSLSSISQA